MWLQDESNNPDNNLGDDDDDDQHRLGGEQLLRQLRHLPLLSDCLQERIQQAGPDGQVKICRVFTPINISSNTILFVFLPINISSFKYLFSSNTICFPESRATTSGLNNHEAGGPHLLALSTDSDSNKSQCQLLSEI